MWLMWARPPGDNVARAHRGEAFINRRATRSRTAEENLRDRRSTVTYLVWPSRQTESNGRRNRHDLAIFGLDQLPSALVHHPMVPRAQQDEVFQLVPAAMHHVDQVVSVAS